MVGAGSERYDVDMASMLSTNRPVGDLLRDWRQHRRRSQLDVALDAGVSTRHISFVETGRSQPSREMLLHLAEHLDIPLRERNTLLVSAGYAPVYSQTSLDDPSMQVVREAVDLVLAGHEPYPALAVDRHWTLMTANRATGMLLSGIAEELLQPPVNVLRVSLHPDGLAPRIVNLAEWRHHVLERLRQQIDATADPVLAALFDELRGYPGVDDHASDGAIASFQRYGGLVVPVRIRSDGGILSFFSTTTVFGTATDVTLAELTIESFFPADEATAEALRRPPTE
jgi:transcriptional regulator with XRE-family HTH domain